jgi:hypothetical protein
MKNISQDYLLTRIPNVCHLTELVYVAMKTTEEGGLWKQALNEWPKRKGVLYDEEGGWKITTGDSLILQKRLWWCYDVYLFICILFNNAVSSSDYMRRMIR